jgi:hypothetical protein
VFVCSIIRLPARGRDNCQQTFCKCASFVLCRRVNAVICCQEPRKDDTAPLRTQLWLFVCQKQGSCALAIVDVMVCYEQPYRKNMNCAWISSCVVHGCLVCIAASEITCCVYMSGPCVCLAQLQVAGVAGHVSRKVVAW